MQELIRQEVKLDKITIGWVEGDTFYTVRTPEHWFFKFEGFGASIAVLAELQNREIENYCVIFKRNLFQVKEFKCKVVDFYNHGEPYTDGDDKQRILPLKYFNQKDRTEVQAQL